MADATRNYFSYGSLKIPAYLTLPAIPTIVGEWASLLPLVCHLASQRCEYQIVGEIALHGRLCLSLFPRLGVLKGISRFLSSDSDFLDEASSKGGQGDIVYDVNWGSIFPCANGKASRFLISYAAEQAKKLAYVSDFVNLNYRQHSTSGFSTYQKGASRKLSARSSGPEFSDLSSESTKTAPKFRRYQVLRVIRISDDVRGQGKYSWRRSLTYFSDYFVALFCVPVVTVALAIAGAYGTAVVLLISLLTRAVCRFSQLQVLRPPGYMSNNEPSNACMLMSIHQNANVWNLFVGDRGAIDTLLNKTMISFRNRGDRSLWLLTIWFQTAHILQLLAMTYVAAQKGFDGIFLLVLMLTTWTFEWFGGGGTALAKQWLEEEGKVINADSFQFTGRMPLLGTVQQLSDNDEASWMDPIIAKCPRRDLWLERIAELRKSHHKSESQLFAHAQDRENPPTPAVDPQWLEKNVRLASEGYSLVMSRISDPQIPIEAQA